MFKIVIVMPVFNDWQSFSLLAQAISATFKSEPWAIEIVAVDDCSTDQSPPETIAVDLPIQRITCLSLVANVGHQRAIAIGLSFVAQQLDVDLVVVMDSDGEDSPAELRRLIDVAKAQPLAVAVAQRAVRSENFAFRANYSAYKIMFSLLTGQSIDFGNFCVLPFRHASALANRPET